MSFKEHFNEIEYFLLDCDGVLWIENEVINRADVAVRKLRENGFKILFVTNTSAKNQQELFLKLKNLGFQPDINEIFCPSLVIAKYLKNIDFKKSAYVIGSKSLLVELTNFGIEAYNHDMLEEIENKETETPDIKAVILGHDTKINEGKLNRAIRYLNGKDVLFLCTGTGMACSHLDEPIFGLGTSYTYLKKMTTAEPMVLGKPSTILFEEIQKIHYFEPNKACMIGDNICTDIKFGNKNNMKSLLVLSGDTYLEEYEEYMKLYETNHDYYLKNHSIPDCVCDDISFFVENILPDDS